ncbi:chromate transporter [Corynebacterium aurimucosum]|uniref:chromate transporter n=1 Tax=Corynebacterium aurimucosum TaxID=169292 RepID=UPI0021CB9248|nr:chromate transporter [Corynebacterium aurimucosum]
MGLRSSVLPPVGRAGGRTQLSYAYLITRANAFYQSGALVFDGGIGRALLGTVLIFVPGALLTLAALHLWARWNHLGWLRGAFSAINAAVVGLLIAALWDPIITHGVTGWASALIAVGAGIALFCKAPPWTVAVGAALAGFVLL